MDDEGVIYVPALVPVFPLPQVILFPGALLPLHIFEPRYRDMMADTLSDSRVVATALLKPGFEPLYYTRRAPIHSVIGLGSIVGSEQLADGNYNVLLRGIGRARIVSESSDRPYRLARIEPMVSFCTAGDDEAHELRTALSDAVRENQGIDPQLRGQWARLFGAALELDDLTDLVGAALPVEAELRQSLLDESDAAARAQALVGHLRTLHTVAVHRRKAIPGGPDSLN